jgi:hypothetical protein
VQEPGARTKVREKHQRVTPNRTIGEQRVEQGKEQGKDRFKGIKIRVK